MLKLTLRRNGRKMATIRVAYHATRDDAVYCLAQQADTDDVPLDGKATKAYVEHALRQCYALYGMDVVMTIGDRLAASDLGEEYLSWAEAQMTRLYPEWT